jgi:hypothetical protein
MRKPKGFFPEEQLESRDPRRAALLVRKREVEKRERELLKEKMVTRQSLLGPITKSAWEWKQHDKKQTTIRAVTSKAKAKTKKAKKQGRKPPQGFFPAEQLNGYQKQAGDR